MNVELKKISTEARNPNTMDIDMVPTIEIIRKLNNEDKTVAYNIEKALDKIAVVVDKVVEAFKKGGRLIYTGAGTSGRIGILDAVECPPTYGVDYEMVQCLMAGGPSAFVKAKEGAEDSIEMAVEDMKNIGLNPNDIVIGIAASGRTPYVVGGMEYAKSIGVVTCCITTSKDSILEKTVDYPIVCVTGPEPITGSTRMKSGTAQKMICNMISTASMVRMGKVYENLLIEMKATNEKLVERSLNIIGTILDCSKEEATLLLQRYKTIKRAVFASLSGITEDDKIDEYLSLGNGNIRESIKIALGDK